MENLTDNYEHNGTLDRRIYIRSILSQFIITFIKLTENILNKYNYLLPTKLFCKAVLLS